MITLVSISIIHFEIFKICIGIFFQLTRNDFRSPSWNISFDESFESTLAEAIRDLIVLVIIILNWNFIWWILIIILLLKRLLDYVRSSMIISLIQNAFILLVWFINFWIDLFIYYLSQILVLILWVEPI